MVEREGGVQDGAHAQRELFIGQVEDQIIAFAAGRIGQVAVAQYALHPVFRQYRNPQRFGHHARQRRFATARHPGEDNQRVFQIAISVITRTRGLSPLFSLAVLI